LLPKEAKVLQDYRMLETQIGGLIPIEVVIHFPDEEGSQKMLDQVYLLASLVMELRQTDDVDAVVSVLNFLPNLPPKTGGGINAVSQRAALEGWINRHQERLRDLRFFDRVEDGDESGYYWRISLRVSAQKRLNYAVMIADVERRLETVKKADDDAAENVRFDVTGGVPLVFRAQEMLLWDLIYSFMTAFGLIALTMMIVLHGVVRGLLAMIPNIFPCVIVFGMLGFCGIPVDMGSMMTASVALGISVDSTLHLLTWVNIALRRGQSRKDAVLYALQRCSTALAQTAIICGVGMLVFGLSDFVPVSRFAILLCSILIISLVGAIVALPAILFSPLGRFFEIPHSSKKNLWRL
jgi:predicted RND superfamily exporter protein